jgi:SAM-dependent methyltransferase
VLLGAAACSRTPFPGNLDVPYVATSTPVAEAMLQLAEVTSRDVVYDLGCGDGRIVILAARRYGAHGVGIDLDPKRIAEARAAAHAAGVERLVTFRQGDLFTADIHEATVVALFLLPDINLRLRPKLQHDLAPGARIVSHFWDMAGWSPEKQIRVEGRTLSLWTVAPHGL